MGLRALVPSGASWILVALVLFFGTLVRSTFGFGEALVAVPLLALILPVKVAAPVAVLASVVIAAWIVVRDRHDIEMRSAVRLALFSLPGIPVGLWILRRAPETEVKGALAVVIVSFSAWSLGTRRKARLEDDRFAWLFGFASGILGGAYGMNGPPLALFGTLRGWSPSRFRATLQGYFLVASAMGMVGYASAGLWTSDVTRFFVVSLPGIACAVPMGRVLNQRLHADRFRRLVYLMLIAIGVVLAAQALPALGKT